MPKFVVKSQEEPNLCCFFCEVEIIRDSEEHDICHITEDGELCCEECLDNCDCECCEKDVCCVGCGKKEIWDCSDRHMCKTCHFKKEEEECNKCGYCDECVERWRPPPSVNCACCDEVIIRDTEAWDYSHISEDNDRVCFTCVDNQDCLCSDCCEGQEPEEEKEDTGFGTAYHDGSGYDDCDPQGKGNRLCGNLSDNDSCSECVYLRSEKKKRFNEIVSPELKQKLQTLTRDELYDFIHK